MTRKPINLQSSARVDFLTRHFCGPGIVSGTSIVSGEVLHRLIEFDPTELFASHVYGPGGGAGPALVGFQTVDGESQTQFGFFRLSVHPVDQQGETRHLALRFSSRDSLNPDERISASYHALRSASLSPLLMRDTQIGGWAIWLFLGESVTRGEAEAVGRGVRGILQDVGVNEGEYISPLLDETSPTVPLPFPFFGGRYFGLLYCLSPEGELRELPLGHGASCTKSPETCTSDLSLDDVMLRIVELWSSSAGTRSLRAGEIATIAPGVLDTSALSGYSTQGRAIAIGRWMMAQDGRAIGRWRVESSRSGNSFRFRLVEAGNE